MSEKNTDKYMLCEYEKIFNHEYHTEGNNKLFKNKLPDGYDIFEDYKILIIIENKKSIKLLDNAKIQIQKYYNNLPQKIKDEYTIYLIIGLGNTKKSFNYKIYNEKFEICFNSLEDIKNTMEIKPIFNPEEIHKLNQYLYDNSINLPKSQKTLFIASILICLKIDKDFIKDYNEESNSYIIADKMIETIQNYYDDVIFTNTFKFIQKSIHNKHLFHIFNVLSIDLKTYGKDILNQFYSEFCLWDKNNDASLGVVLTPHDIVELMVKELNLNENDKVLDFCTGTGSFLIECGKYTNNLYGCENNEERYSLCKCNFILNDLNYNHLKYNSCFNINYKSNCFNKIIINPPFSCKCLDENNKNNNYNWKSFDEEQKFIMYMIELLKINGLGCCIIPRSNFNNTMKKNNDFKKEILKYCKIIKIINCNDKVFVPNASVECTILILQKINNYNEENEINNNNVEVIDYSDDGYKIKKKLRYYDHKPIIKTQYKDLIYNSDWNYLKEINNDININKLILNYNNDYQNSINKFLINKLENDKKDYQQIKLKLNELLEIINVKSYQTDKSDIGDYPLYGATQLNNPVKFINNYSIDTYNNDDLNIKLYGVFCINKTGNGGAGICFKRYGKFAINSTVLCCKMKYFINDYNVAYISYQLHNILNRSNSLNITKFNELEINILLDCHINIGYIINEYIKENIKIKEWRLLKIDDYFEIIKPIKIFQISKSKDGIIPLISSTSLNNGYIKFINDFSYNGECLSIARNGSVGSCFYQFEKIGITTDIILLKSKENNNISLHIWAMLLNYYLPKKYSYSNKLSKDKLLNEEINMPIIDE